MIDSAIRYLSLPLASTHEKLELSFVGFPPAPTEWEKSNPAHFYFFLIHKNFWRISWCFLKKPYQKNVLLQTKSWVLTQHIVYRIGNLSHARHEAFTY